MIKHILIIASHGPSIISFRLSLIKKLISIGYSVTVAAPDDKFSENLQKKLRDLGVNVIILSLFRNSFNLLKDLKTILEIYKIIRKINPNLIISYTAKPVIYTGIVLKFFKKITHYPLITGLGYAFIDRNSINHKILKYILINLYRISLKTAEKTIFQNKDDQYLFYRLKIIGKKNCHIL